jgi:phosphate:Na+ symporter
VKDIGTNISNLRNSSKDIKYKFFIHNKQETEALYRQFNALMTEENLLILKIYNIFLIIEENYSSALNTFYSEAQDAR